MSYEKHDICHLTFAHNKHIIYIVQETQETEMPKVKLVVWTIIAVMMAIAILFFQIVTGKFMGVGESILVSLLVLEFSRRIMEDLFKNDNK